MGQCADILRQCMIELVESSGNKCPSAESLPVWYVEILASLDDAEWERMAIELLGIKQAGKLGDIWREQGAEILQRLGVTRS